TGIEAGGRTGLTVLVVAICFAATLFFSPFVTAIPAQAYGPALILVGLFMLEPISKINFADYTESIPAFAVVTLMCFSFNIGVGITAGFVLYPLGKLVTGKMREIKPGMWILTTLSLLFFILLSLPIGLARPQEITVWLALSALRPAGLSGFVQE